jgi:hypothetical protein
MRNADKILLLWEWLISCSSLILSQAKKVAIDWHILFSWKPEKWSQPHTSLPRGGIHPDCSHLLPKADNMAKTKRLGRLLHYTEPW